METDFSIKEINTKERVTFQNEGIETKLVETCNWNKVTPVFKKGDRQEENNDRPITSLISVDEIFEQLLSNQITGHYDPTLYHRMTAYRKK